MSDEKYKHLKPESHYVDRYDDLTVSICRELGNSIASRAYKSADELGLQKDESKLNAAYAVANIAVYFKAGEMWERKKETIAEWMNEDRLRDERIDSATPRKVTCPVCGGSTICIHTELHHKGISGEEILFMYECGDCNKRVAYWESGEKYQSTAKCPKCSGELKSKHERKNDVITTTYSCANCDYLEVDKLNLKEKEPTKVKDENFEADKKRFCFTDEEGGHYITSKFDLKFFSERMKADEQKKLNQGLYNKVAQLKKLNIADLTKLILTEIEKINYVNLELNRPEMGKFVTVEFSVQDSESARNEHDSKMKLKKTLESVLSDTNWRLMSDGIYYRMGILTGRLKGYDREEDLLELVKR